MNGIDREKAEEYFRKNPDMKRLAEETMDEWISESCRWASEGKFSFLISNFTSLREYAKS